MKIIVILQGTGRMKLIEYSSQIAALTIEENKLKSLHRRLEMRIKRFLHRTRNSILKQEYTINSLFLSFKNLISINLRKLLNIEKHSQKKLLLQKNLITHKKPSKENQILWNNIQQIEEDNINLEKNISSLCNKVILEYENKFNK
jgi:hypothetical protein